MDFNQCVLAIQQAINEKDEEVKSMMCFKFCPFQFLLLFFSLVGSTEGFFVKGPETGQETRICVPKKYGHLCSLNFFIIYEFGSNPYNIFQKIAVNNARCNGKWYSDVGHLNWDRGLRFAYAHCA